MSMMTVVVGSIVLVLLLMAVPQLGLGFGFTGLAAAIMIVIFGFLFVTVSARLTGEIGSSSNPISGMTVATRRRHVAVQPAPAAQQLKAKYGFDPTDKWLEHLQLSVVRFNSGGQARLSRRRAGDDQSSRGAPTPCRN